MKSQPFSHQDLQLKQHFLGLARSYHAKTSTGDDEADLANELAAALLYMNVADYMAEYLVTSMNQMAKEAVTRYYLGIVSIRAPKREGFNIGESMKFLNRFDFPKKGEILAELEAINDARKKIAHQILKKKADELQDIDDAVKLLADHTEQLVVLVDEINPGMPPTTLLEKMQAESGDK